METRAVAHSFFESKSPGGILKIKETVAMEREFILRYIPELQDVVQVA